jgi:hypothetical protein
MAWTQLDSVTLSSSGTLETGTFTPTSFLFVQVNCQAHGAADSTGFQFNSDTASGSTNYGRRSSLNGGTDEVRVSKNTLFTKQSDTTDWVSVNMWISNMQDEEKNIILYQLQDASAGASTAPTRSICAGKWANTTEQIEKIRVVDHDANFNDRSAGSNIVVWGSD